MQTKVSVITVCFNASGVIEKTIKSVIEQSYKDLEYIIIDGLSTDGTMSIVELYSKHIDYYISEPDNGIYDAMNKGILRSTGDYLIFMNAGDEFIGNNVIDQLVYSSGNISLVHGNIIRCFRKRTIKSSGIYSDKPSLMDFLYDTFHHQSCLIKRNLFQKYGLYDTNYKLCSDWKFYFDCVILNGVDCKYVDIDVAKFAMDGASTKHKDLYLEERRQYLRSIYGDEIYGYLDELYNYRKSRLASTIMRFRYSLKKNHFLQALRKKLLLID